MACQADQFFPEPKIGVGGILFNLRKEVLLIRRGKPPAEGAWSVPGGRLEAGESLTECCRREVLEETGLDVKVLGLAAVVERRIENFHYVIIDFLVELRDETLPNLPQPASDVTEARWIGLENIRDYDLVPGLPEIIRRAANLQRGGYDSASGTDFIV